jgi:hypothetical protein
LSDGKSVGNKKKLLPTDLLTEQTRKKQITRFIPSVYPSKNTIGNSVGNYLKTFKKNPFYKIIKLT